MSTIIRVKRKLNKDQTVDEKIVLNIKKQKVEDNFDKKISQEEKTVLKFAGTVNQKENTEENILKLTKSEAEKIVLRKNFGESKLQKRLSENKEKSQNNRFTVLNFTRSNGSKFAENPDEELQLTIVDVEKEKQKTSETTDASISSKNNLESEYVYDIYIAEKAPTSFLGSDSLDINDLSILDYNDYLYSCPRLTNDTDDDEEFGADSSDSNDENYYKNDYPDEEDDFSDDNESIGEREMRRAIRNFDIDNDLSSDDGEENYVYSVDAEGVEFEDDLDFSDVGRYGLSYARYKKKVLREMEDDDD